MWKTVWKTVRKTVWKTAAPTGSLVPPVPLVLKTPPRYSAPTQSADWRLPALPIVDFLDEEEVDVLID